MAWVEMRSRSILVRARVNGKPKTVETFPITQEEEARQYARALSMKPEDAELTLRRFFYDESSRGYRAQVEIAPTTWAGYEVTMRCHVLPILGEMPVATIRKVDVQEMMRTLERDKKKAPTRIRCHAVLSAVMAVLEDNNTIAANPCRGVRVPKYTRPAKNILEQDEAWRLIQCMPNDAARLLTYVVSETGMRSGEVRELRVKDIKFGQQTEITISRAVSEVNDDINPDGTGGFHVRSATKGGESEARVCPIPQECADELLGYVRAKGLLGNDLVFPARLVAPATRTAEPVPTELTPEVLAGLGHTEPDARGRTYPHGTMTAYVSARCRCSWCRTASREYQAARRAKLGVTRRTANKRTNLTGHLSAATWERIWESALLDARLDPTLRMHSIRHSVAVWMLEAGMPMPVVADQLGHGDIKTTAAYTRLTSRRARRGESLMGGAAGAPVLRAM